MRSTNHLDSVRCTKHADGLFHAYSRMLCMTCGDCVPPTPFLYAFLPSKHVSFACKAISLRSYLRLLLFMMRDK